MSNGSGALSRRVEPQADKAACGTPKSRWQIAECLLPGVNAALAEELGERIRTELARSRSPVTFAGSLLMPEDEVLLLLFAGPVAEVRAVSERAGLPFERILGCLRFG
jgi:hypothetical protein